jgi:MerR family transcriptional regulator, light-induced transcriptional regulator
MPKRALARLVPIHPIQVVAHRTGLSADVIRAWEKRYTVVAPARSENGRRLYSGADIERLQLLAQATASGRTIGQLAALPAAALSRLVTSDGADPRVRHAQRRSGEFDASPDAAVDHFAAAVDAVAQFDAPALDAALRRATIVLSGETFLDAVVLPLWIGVIAEVRAGTLRAAHRHLAFTALRRALDGVTDMAATPLASPDLVVSTLSGPHEQLGALLVAAAAAAEGWKVTYLGPGLPAEDIADAAALAGARAVALSLGGAPNGRSVSRELQQFRRLLPRGSALIVEGAAAELHARVVRDAGALVARSLAALRAHLGTLRGADEDSTGRPAEQQG